MLIFDEVTAGWRYNLGGAHLPLNVDPDIAVFAKAISDGYPMGALIGKQPVMDALERTFLSGTYWTERIDPAAVITTVDQDPRLDCPAASTTTVRSVCWWTAKSAEKGFG